MTISDSNSNEFDLWGGLDANQISDDPFQIADGWHKCVVEEAKFTKSKEGKPALTITYKVVEGDSVGSTVRDWFGIGPIPATPGTSEYDKAVRARSFLKKRLISLSVPSSKLAGAGFDPADLLGIMGEVKVKKNGDNYNVQDFKMESDGGGGSSSNVYSFS